MTPPSLHASHHYLPVPNTPLSLLAAGPPRERLSRGGAGIGGGNGNLPRVHFMTTFDL